MISLFVGFLIYEKSALNRKHFVSFACESKGEACGGG